MMRHDPTYTRVSDNVVEARCSCGWSLVGGIVTTSSLWAEHYVNAHGGIPDHEEEDA